MKAAEITPAQCRAARRLLRWSQGELAAKTWLPFSYVVEFEQNSDIVSAETIAAIRFAFEDAGIEFEPEDRGGEGVKLRRDETNPVLARG